jgi:peptidylprolyl isomerase
LTETHTVPRLFRLALLPVALLLSAAGNPSAIIAQRGDVTVTAAEVETLLRTLDPDAQARLRANPGALADAVRERLLREVLLAEAQAAKWDTRPEIAARAEDARMQVIVQSFIASQTLPTVAEPTEKDIETAYEASKGRLIVPRQYNLAQIAILVPPDASKETEEELRKKALDIRAQALKPKADFAELARKFSQDKPTADKGGDLGWVREDVLIPAIRSAVQTMKDGTISEPIRSPESWHVVRLGSTRPTGILSLEQARDGIIQALKQARAQAAARNFVQQMIAREPIRLNEIELSRQFPAVEPKK